MSQVPCSGNTKQAGYVDSHSSVSTAGSTGARQVRFLAQGSNNSRSILAPGH